ncbi:MAG TPA: hypothetical protein VMT28_16125 [Terriglobales bacterium]|jgi:hypothetical protein|nr:hypothetical protein [Terriglobales bacterium]
MKITCFVLCLLCASAAFGQAAAAGSALSSEPVVFQIPGHVRHASQTAMAPEQSLLQKSTYLYARGERPLWEVMPEHDEMPLGDVARMFREEHATAKKATHVLEK